MKTATAALPLLLLLPTLSCAAPALCSVELLTTCKPHSLEKCTPRLWHGIDSLEEVEITPLNATAIMIRSLARPAKSFEDTVGVVVVQDLSGAPVEDPEAHCVHAPPLPTGEGNCTTHVRAFFSDANATLVTTMLQSCGILTWLPSEGGTGHAYAQWVHADEPKPSPPGAMCAWNNTLYKEVGSNFPDIEYFTLENVKDSATGAINETAVRIHSVNHTFPDTTARVREVGAGTPGKIAWKAALAGGENFRGIMRANSAGGIACCEVSTDRKTGAKTLKNCPVLSWWSPSGDHFCWQPAEPLPSENIGGCGE